MNYPYKIQALEDKPCFGDVMKGEIGIMVREEYYDFPSQKSYYVPICRLKDKFKIIQQEKEIIYEIY
jgi:hypothetical protein